MKETTTKRGGFSHDPHYEGLTDDWITPKYFIDALGPFDLDPCASLTQPWPCACQSLTVKDDGLACNWQGNIWLNPPYGPHTSKWVKKLVGHGSGIALIFGRTDTKLWQDEIFPTADGFLFIQGRVKFYLPNGTLHPGGNAGAPSVLIAWGDTNREKLIYAIEAGTILGAFLDRPFYSKSLCIAPQNTNVSV